MYVYDHYSKQILRSQVSVDRTIWSSGIKHGSITKFKRIYLYSGVGISCYSKYVLNYACIF